jgi:trans-aconitate methyltransferase
MAPLYRQWPLASLLAIDCTAKVLPLAQQQLGQVTYPCSWLEMDLLAWASSANQVDLILTSFAVHHLNDNEKRQFLQGCSAKLRPGGLLLWADVFRMPGEQQQEYMDRYSQRVRQGWFVLNAGQQEQVINHLSSCDFPAAADAVIPLAESVGFCCRWLWRGEHQAEALMSLMKLETG